MKLDNMLRCIHTAHKKKGKEDSGSTCTCTLYISPGQSHSEAHSVHLCHSSQPRLNKNSKN